MPPPTLRRRAVLAALLLPLAARRAGADDAADPWPLLRSGGVVLAMRHALAPGTYDPPGFRLDDCASQRNLSDEGREQARRLGRAVASRGLVPAAVRSSPWCRCIDTATLAFGRAEAWAALGSPVAGSEADSAAHLTALRTALADAARRPGRFEVWVTHQFVLNDLAGASTGSGEGLVLRAEADGSVRVRARLAPA
jgi:hypothetical protein